MTELCKHVILVAVFISRTVTAKKAGLASRMCLLCIQYPKVESTVSPSSKQTVADNIRTSLPLSHLCQKGMTARDRPLALVYLILPINRFVHFPRQLCDRLCGVELLR